jgi:hypothetical protein
MATGIQTATPRVRTVRLVESATAANAAPAGAPSATPAATVGFKLDTSTLLTTSCTVRIYETAGSGTMAMTYARAWGYSATATKWFPMGIGADATKGYLNGGAAFGETGANELRHAEALGFINHWDGIYIEFGTISGTNTALSCEIDFPINENT